MEGRSTLALSNNHSNNRTNILQDVPSGDPQNGQTRPIQVISAQRIDTWLIAAIVSLAVDLDEQSRGQAGEIRNITAHRVLTTEFETAWPRSQRLP